MNQSNQFLGTERVGRRQPETAKKSVGNFVAMMRAGSVLRTFVIAAFLICGTYRELRA